MINWPCRVVTPLPFSYNLWFFKILWNFYENMHYFNIFSHWNLWKLHDLLFSRWLTFLCFGSNNYKWTKVEFYFSFLDHWLIITGHMFASHSHIYWSHVAISYYHFFKKVLKFTFIVSSQYTTPLERTVMLGVFLNRDTTMVVNSSIQSTMNSLVNCGRWINAVGYDRRIGTRHVVIIFYSRISSFVYTC